jgi:hypothetical protein
MKFESLMAAPYNATSACSVNAPAIQRYVSRIPIIEIASMLSGIPILIGSLSEIPFMQESLHSFCVLKIM